MSANKRRFKGGKINEPFVAVYRTVLECRAMEGLSGRACKLLMGLMAQYRGDNNGDLTAAWGVMKDRGWSSKATLQAAKIELIKAGFVYITRKGAFPKTTELLALTWFALDVNPDKFDAGALAGFESRSYLTNAERFEPLNKKRSPLYRNCTNDTYTGTDSVPRGP
jgi:hypothetical protein